MGKGGLIKESTVLTFGLGMEPVRDVFAGGGDDGPEQRVAGKLLAQRRQIVDFAQK